jgi:hypothetical protein
MLHRILLHFQESVYDSGTLCTIHLLLQKASQNIVLAMTERGNPYLLEMDGHMKTIYPSQA